MQAEIKESLGIKIGLEVHVQLTALKTKLFCGCDADYRSAPPNTYTCPICLGLPGSLPVVNEKAVEYIVKIALALNCKIIDREVRFFRNLNGNRAQSIQYLLQRRIAISPVV